MEPFSFFQILQSFLPKQSDGGESAPVPKNEQTAENTPSAEVDISQETPVQSDAQNAFLHFMETHDERIRRTRK